MRERKKKHQRKRKGKEREGFTLPLIVSVKQTKGRKWGIYNISFMILFFIKIINIFHKIRKNNILTF